MRDIIFDKTPDSTYFYGPAYSELIDSMEYNIVFEETIGSYQGDYLYFFEDSDKYGLLVFGYGSCSGCDSLEACSDEKEVTSLRDSIESEIKWFKTKEEVAKFIWDTDKKAFKDWWYYDDEADKFLDKVYTFCGGKNGRKKKNSEED